MRSISRRGTVDDQSPSTSGTMSSSGETSGTQNSVTLYASSDSEFESDGAEAQAPSQLIDSATQFQIECSSNVHIQPHQPNLKVFPKVSTGNSQSRGFQPSWFRKWQWLEWNDENKSAFCHPCRMAALLKFSLSKKSRKSFFN